MCHLAILFTNFGPYHIARAEACQAYCSGKKWNLSAIEISRSDMEYLWEIDPDELSFPLYSVAEESLNHIPFHKLVIRLYALLNKLNPDAVAIAGYSRPCMLAALFWCCCHRKIPILFSETHEQDTPRVPWREVPKTMLLRLYKAALVGGKPQHRYLAKLGMKPEAIFYGYNIVDNSAFSPQQLASLPNPLSHPYFLTVNRFIPKKNLFRLIDAYAQYNQQAGSSAWHLVLAGDGMLRNKIEDKVTSLKLNNFIHLTGFLQQQQLLPYFAHANCFIHASTHEQWGLVVNEAMASGLPALVSYNCGCFEDLVIEGKTGFGFDPTKVAQLSQLMTKISSSTSELSRMSKEATQHMRKFSPDYFAKGLFSAAEYALD